MLLALDIGNTNITFGIFNTNENSPDNSPKATWRVATDPNRLSDEYLIMLRSLLELKGMSTVDVKSVAISSVVPPLTPVFTNLFSAYLKIDPMVMGAGIRTGIKILYDNPRDVGADRIADAAAALHLYGGPSIIVDFGTATVFDAVSAKSEYVGGAIAPGLIIGAESLFQSTSQLRKVEIERPASAIGKNTIHALQSGLVLGYADLVKGMVARFDRELGGGSKTIATGGLANLIAQETDIFDEVNPDLTLIGLNIIHHMNS